MIRKTIIVGLSVAALACIPLHCFCMPDVNRVEFATWFSDNEKYTLHAYWWSLQLHVARVAAVPSASTTVDLFVFRYESAPGYTALSVPLFVVGAALAAYPFSAVFIRWYRNPPAARRRKRGLCVRCGYNLEGNTSGTCPECGSEASS